MQLPSMHIAKWVSVNLESVIKATDRLDIFTFLFKVSYFMYFNLAQMQLHVCI